MDGSDASVNRVRKLNPRYDRPTNPEKIKELLAKRETREAEARASAQPYVASDSSEYESDDDQQYIYTIPARNGNGNSPVHYVFGKAENCDYSKDLCYPLVIRVEKEPCYYFQLEQEDCFSRDASGVAEERARELLYTLLGSGDVLCANAERARGDSVFEVNDEEKEMVVEIGPKLRHRTPWCSHVMSACRSAGIALSRIEMTTRYKFTVGACNDIQENWREIASHLYDPILEQIYEEPIDSFFDYTLPLVSTWEEIPLKVLGKNVLKKTSDEHSLGFDEHDIEAYYDLFMKLNRNPTLVELYDLAQSNSEHSRHWFFTGEYYLDGTRLPRSLMQMVKDTNTVDCTTNMNNVIKFKDNSSAIKGFEVYSINSSNPEQAALMWLKRRMVHLLLTAETHNFPTGVVPFSGAATGTGGRIRDVMATGRGANVIAATAGYCVGQLHIDSYKLPWEEQSGYDGHFEKPLKIIIDASNGASDYGNKFGEPVIGGFFRSFGCKLGGERREWVKPIMFSAGIGTLYDEHVEKTKVDPRELLHIAKIGGPAYRIGIGGGAASSTMIQGENKDVTSNAVQRGDPEMGNKLNRLVRACTELEVNPIQSIHDQGAGGNANVLKEIVDGHGADIYAPRFTLGDNTLTLKELWCAEYQESNAILFKEEHTHILEKLAKRERCLLDIVGEVTQSDRFRFIHCDQYSLGSRERVPVEFHLKQLEEMPRKVFEWTSKERVLTPLKIKNRVTVLDAIERVLRLASVGSKRFLTSKVDRSVTGLVAQQQCVGERQLPLADVAVVACSYFSHEGIATTTGEQPIITMLNPAAGACMSLMEALASMVMAPITSLKDVKCSVNWMWPAKLEGEGFQLYEACEALCNLMKFVGVAVDGGKDSLGMAAKTVSRGCEERGDEIVKAPGTVVVTAYAPCTDITKVVNPDLKGPRTGSSTTLLLVRPVAHCRSRLGGSALAQVYGRGFLGKDTPNFTTDDAKVFIKAFSVMQELINEGVILACHDISEGGVLTCLIEMAMAGSCGLNVTLPYIKEQDGEFAKGSDDVAISFATLFSEEIGWIIEVRNGIADDIMENFRGIFVFKIGSPTFCDTGLGESPKVEVRGGHDGENLWFSENLTYLRRCWEDTSYRLELYQTTRDCALEEYEYFPKEKKLPSYRVTFDFMEHWPGVVIARNPFRSPKVAVLREEGTNGDREMMAALMMAGFLVADLTMTDLFNDKGNLHEFRGLVFPGGFSYADSLGAAVGWAACLKGDKYARGILNQWHRREDTFSLAVCNGCQLTALLGWQNLDGGWDRSNNEPLPDHRFTTNKSGRFESRWSRVKVDPKKSILLNGMNGSVLGVWVAHKEGRFTPRGDVSAYKDRVVLTYVDDDHLPTEQYPHNPNGSPGGVAGVVSKCGRHLAMMPHPERSVLTWQWPDLGSHSADIATARPNKHMKQYLERTAHLLTTQERIAVEEGLKDTAPWAMMFQNAFDWCVGEDDLEPNILPSDRDTITQLKFNDKRGRILQDIV